MSDWKKLRELAEAATPGPWEEGTAGACNVVITILALLDENDSLRFQLAEEQRLGTARLQAQLEIGRERDEARAEVERLRAAIETSQLVKDHDALVDQLSAALAAKEEACEIAMAGIIDPDDRERIIALRSIGKDGGNG